MDIIIVGYALKFSSEFKTFKTITQVSKRYWHVDLHNNVPEFYVDNCKSRLSVLK